jgi:hypothetical protein
MLRTQRGRAKYPETAKKFRQVHCSAILRPAQ